MSGRCDGCCDGDVEISVRGEVGRIISIRLTLTSRPARRRATAQSGPTQTTMMANPWACLTCLLDKELLKIGDKTVGK